jgi:hypothetical protein
MNSNSFENKHLKIYIEGPDDPIKLDLESLSDQNQYSAILAWGKYLIHREIEPIETEILEKIWESRLKENGVTRYDGINYLYFQLCSIVAYRISNQLISKDDIA